LTIKLKISNYRVLKDVDLEVGKTILYGPNSSGKSSIIYALIKMAAEEHPDDILREIISHGLAGSRIRVESEGAFLEYEWKNGSYTYRCSHPKIGSEEGSSLLSIEDCARRFWSDAGIRRVGHISYDRAYIFYTVSGNVVELESFGKKSRLSIKNILGFYDWSDFFSVPEILSDPVAEDLWNICGIERVYGPFARVEDKWIPISSLAEGFRRAIAVIIGARYSDLLLIEGFENSLHADLAANLLNLLESIKGLKVMIETHSGAIVLESLSRAGRPKPWSVYFVSGGSAKRITWEDLSNLALIKREKELYSLI